MGKLNKEKNLLDIVNTLTIYLIGTLLLPFFIIFIWVNLWGLGKDSGFIFFEKWKKILLTLLSLVIWFSIVFFIFYYFNPDHPIFSFLPNSDKNCPTINEPIQTPIICPTQIICTEVVSVPTPVIIATPSIDPNIVITNTPNSPDEYEMIFIPGGEFYMGKSGSNNTDELFHKVEVSDFFIDKYEVSNAEYTKCVEAGYCRSPKIQFSESFGDLFSINKDFSDYPIVNVTWNQANDYCEWRGARLPTEAEFERAAGFNPESSYSFEYPWGNNQVNNTLANFRSSSPEPIDTYENGDNQLGVYNLVGNVWEWVNDNYSRFYYTEKEYLQEFKNPMGSKDSYGKVIKGGGWDSYEYQVTRYSKLSKSAGTFLNNLGFRCANYSE